MSVECESEEDTHKIITSVAASNALNTKEFKKENPRNIDSEVGKED